MKETSGRGLIAAALVGSLALGAWTVSGVFGDPLNRLPDTQFTSGDLFAVSLARAELWTRGYIPDHTALIAWPTGAAFNPIMWPLLVLGFLFEPVVALWLTFALTPVANALGGLVLGRTLGLTRVQQATLAGALAWSPWVRETLANGQLEQTWPGIIALLWALGVRASERGGWSVPAVGVFAAVCGASFPHLALGAGVGLGVLLLTRRKAGTPWLRVVAVLGLAALGLALAGVWHASGYNAPINAFAPKGSASAPGGLEGLPESAAPLDFVKPPAPPTRSGVLHSAWLGWAVPFAAGWALLRERARAAPFAWASAALLVLALGSRLGPVPMPYAILPMLSDTVARSGSPYRMVGAAIVGLAVVAAMGVRSKRAGIALVALAWLETLAFGTRALPYATRTVPRDPVVAALNAHAGAVLDLPLGSKTCDAGHYAQEATRRRRPVPVVTSGVPYSAARGLVRSVAVAESQPDCGAALRELVLGQGYTSVVVHDHGCRVSDRLLACVTSAFGAPNTVPMAGANDHGEPASIRYWMW